MNTQMIFYEKPYETEFTALVKRVEALKKGFRVSLDRTLFYPEGGGQPADRGTVAGIPVAQVEKKDGEVWHYLNERPPEGEVEGRIDWSHRFDYMQQHTGQHILSAVMYRDFGFNTVAIHQGSETTSIEIDRPEIDDPTIEAIEVAAMELIGRNLTVTKKNVDEGEIDRYDLRREPKVSGTIRVVALGEYDAVACGGMHTATTGEVKLIKHVQTEKIRGNIRLHWKIGDRALRDYGRKNGIIASLVERFSAQPPELLERIEASMEELTESRRRINMLEARLAGQIALQLFEEASRSQSNIDHPLVMTADFEGEEKDFLKKLAEGLQEQKHWAIAAVNRREESFQWLIAASDQGGFDFNLHKRDLLPLIEGKGGGRPPLWQGIGLKPEGIPGFFDMFRKKISTSE